MRLFIAIEVPKAVIDLAVDIQQSLKNNYQVQGSYVYSDAMHLTVKFLDSVDEDKIPGIDSALKSIRAEPLVAKTDSLGIFRTRKDTAAVYLHVSSPALQVLAQQIDGALTSYFKPEGNIFVAHLTLVRIRGMEQEHKILQAINTVRIQPLEFSITEFVLKESQHVGKSVYRDVGRYALLRA